MFYKYTGKNDVKLGNIDININHISTYFYNLFLMGKWGFNYILARTRKMNRFNRKSETRKGKRITSTHSSNRADDPFSWDRLLKNALTFPRTYG